MSHASYPSANLFVKIKIRTIVLLSLKNTVTKILSMTGLNIYQLCF